MKAEQDSVASSTRQLETLFRATGKSVDDFAGALGNRLVNAIKSGTATSRQLGIKRLVLLVMKHWEQKLILKSYNVRFVLLMMVILYNKFEMI